MDTEQRAIRAKHLQEDPILREVLDGLRDSAIEAWQQTATADVQQREFSWLTVKVISRIEQRLQSIIDDQHISAANLVRVPR